MPSNGPAYIVPDWPAPATVRAAITLRSKGQSQVPFNGFNLADHVGDNSQAVYANRQSLIESLGLSAQPIWLNQVHGAEVVYAPEIDGLAAADSCYSDRVGQACVVLSADCLPVLLCNRDGTQVAAAHAGWRGLCGGILGNTLAHFGSDETVLAYLGPAIGPRVFEVGAEVLEAFLSSARNTQHQQSIERAFVATVKGRYLADLYALAKAELLSCGVSHIYGGSFCSYSQPEQFYSYRRDQVTGRNASLVWLESP
ncbi:MAG: peptidoglycan editing factor PgeF [Porticoccaceae bacterium]|nr:peptidoglycan editing factor PgeF [Porticoccaceae bacterium]